MRFFFTSTIILLVVPLAVAGQLQGPCTLGLDKAPVIRGIRLGMTISEVRTLYPIIGEPKERGTDGTSDMSYFKSDGYHEGLKGIHSLILFLFNGRVYHISVDYDEPDYWRELTELVKPIGLPNEGFAAAQCRGFRVTVFRHSDRQTLWVSDSLAEKKVSKYRNELEENSADCQTAPVIRRVSLGMTTTQFRSLYPRAQVAMKRSEVGELVLRNINVADPRLKGISALWAYFLDDALYFLVVDYTNQIEWKDIDQFVEQFSRSTGYRTKWEGYDENPEIRALTPTRTLRCHGFIIGAKMTDGGPKLWIQERTAVSKLNKREEQLKSPTTFRP
jgi:hypothetical protein